MAVVFFFESCGTASLALFDSPLMTGPKMERDDADGAIGAWCGSHSIRAIPSRLERINHPPQTLESLFAST